MEQEYVEWTEPKSWHSAHSFEPSSCANYTLILIASLSSHSKQINSASSNCHTHSVSASKKMCFLGTYLVRFTVHCLPQVSVTLISMCYYLKKQMSWQAMVWIYKLDGNQFPTICNLFETDGDGSHNLCNFLETKRVWSL